MPHSPRIVIVLVIIIIIAQPKMQSQGLLLTQGVVGACQGLVIPPRLGFMPTTSVYMDGWEEICLLSEV